MKRFFKFLAILMLVFMIAVPAQAAFKDMWAAVYTWDGGMNGDGTMKLAKIETGITFKVLQAGSDTAETLYEYGDQLMTSLTNPVTTTSFEDAAIMQHGAGTIAFKVDPGETNDVAVDLIVVDSVGGYTAFVEDFDKKTHSIVIDERPGVVHHGMIWFNAQDTTDEQNPEVDFDYDTAIHDVIIEVVTTDAGEIIDVGTDADGTAGDANGFRDGVLVSATGFPTDTAVITDGATNNDYYPVSTYGELLVTAITGTDSTVNNGGKTPIGPYMITGANEQTLSYSFVSACDNTDNSFMGYIHYFFTRIR